MNVVVSFQENFHPQITVVDPGEGGGGGGCNLQPLFMNNLIIIINNNNKELMQSLDG